MAEDAWWDACVAAERQREARQPAKKRRKRFLTLEQLRAELTAFGFDLEGSNEKKQVLLDLFTEAVQASKTDDSTSLSSGNLARVKNKWLQQQQAERLKQKALEKTARERLEKKQREEEREYAAKFGPWSNEELRGFSDTKLEQLRRGLNSEVERCTSQERGERLLDAEVSVLREQGRRIKRRDTEGKATPVPLTKDQRLTKDLKSILSTVGVDVPARSTLEELRKSSKKASLLIHPDRVRKGASAEEIKTPTAAPMDLAGLMDVPSMGIRAR
ncbi:hypothetical protein KFL_001810030 [Klebsormidium nitens]|uniref:Uncharacterized protein n=1 Tax=Klebsormidium nitens TaxID=105231 RepID=A0A1Y1I4X7_KLENI|nr:hypothetical protein KFL_001810030 [Klebsormidium nitens]|eukprot:GAQ84221.1 hypothetical protein KFL_001810030 [Klebsormidium nitens]